MFRCDICGKDDIGTERGLAAHRLYKHPNGGEPLAEEAVAEQVIVEPKKLKSNGRLSTGGLNRSLKMVKMIQARCRVCNPRGQGKRGWWLNCPHDPYHHVEEKPGAVEFEEQSDGTIVKLDTPKVEYTKVANFKQIPDEPSMASGRMVQIQIERGSKFPKDLGYAPICDYYNCWEENPKIHANRVIRHEGIQTRVGDYHSRDEAAIMTLRLNQTPVYIGMGDDIANRRAQLDEVNVS